MSVAPIVKLLQMSHSCVRNCSVRAPDPNQFSHGHYIPNHKNYNFLDCYWFKKLLFSTNSLTKLLSDSLLSDSSISQSHSKL